MKYNVVIENVVTKTYGARVEIDADNESQAREKAEDIAIEATLEGIEADWGVWEHDSTWNVLEVEEAA